MAEMHKKMAAALAAVNAYLQDEEAARAAAEMHAGASRQTSFLQPNFWGQSGRQEMMSMRRLIQMRAFDRCR